MLNKIIKAYETKDIEALKKLVVSKNRELNKTTSYRSPLMLSAHNLKHLLKIDELKTDSIILNLEDGVSEEQKPFALLLCAYFLSIHQKCEKKLIVRVNELSSGGYDEIAFLNAFMPDAIRVPKIKSKDEIISIRELLDEQIELHISIETKEAWQNLASFGGYVDAFYLGIYDLVADMNINKNIITPSNPLLKHILAHFLLTSKAIGVKPISFIYQNHRDIASFKEFVELAKSMSYDAIACISPTQVDLLQQILKLDEDELKEAKDIVELFEAQRAKGISGFDTKEYGFIDEPIYKNALRRINGY